MTFSSKYWVLTLVFMFLFSTAKPLTANARHVKYIINWWRNHIEAETKWFPLCRRHSQTHLIKYNLLYLYSDFNRIGSQNFYKFPINGNTVMVQMMVWCGTCVKLLSKSIIVEFIDIFASHGSDELTPNVGNSFKSKFTCILCDTSTIKCLCQSKGMADKAYLTCIIYTMASDDLGHLLLTWFNLSLNKDK